MALGDARGSENVLDRRHRVVLWALAVSRPHPATRDQIAAALWPDEEPATRDKVIQGSISQLRKVYGADAIRTVAGGYALTNRVMTECDDFEKQVTRARQLLTTGQADRAAFILAAALESWTGAPYDALGHWPPALAEQGRLTELTRQAEELHVEALLAAGRAADALPIARLLATAEPLREPRWRAWATAAFLTGNQADALQVLRECRTTLREELGIDPSTELDALEVAILRQEATPTTGPSRASSSACPWPGLRAYEQSDADAFFGRDCDIANGLRTLYATGVVAVAGPSGIGKSSFVRAGLATALSRSGRTVHLTTPRLAPGSRTADVMVLDQAEELFTLSPDRVVDIVAQLDLGPSVLSIRTDRLSEASRCPQLARLLERGLYLLGGIGAEELRDVVEGPARQVGLVVEPGLVDLILRDVEHEPAALPLLSHALVETWRRREGRTLTIDGYRSAGGVGGAVAQTAEALYAGLAPSRRRELRSLMLRLVHTDDEGKTSRTHVDPHRIAAPADLVEELVAARLVSSDDVSLTLTHESLITAWPRFHDWLADDLEGRRQLQHLSQAAATWDQMGRPDSELYRGARLDRAIAWAGTTPFELSRTELDFLEAGRAAWSAEQQRERLELDRQRRTNRRLRALALGLAVVTTAAVATGAFAAAQQREAAEQARVSAAAERQADANRVSALALNTDDPQVALLLAVAAQKLAPGTVTRRSLSAVLAARAELIAAVATSDAATTGSSLGDPVVSGARLYALDGRHVLHVMTGSLRTLATVDLGDGRIDRDPAPLAASADLVAAPGGPGRNPPVILVDGLTLRRLPLRLEGLPRGDVRVDSLDLSPDGRTLSAAVQVSQSELAMTWALPSGRLLGPPVDAAPGAEVHVSDDGRRLFTSNPLGAYDVRSGRRVWHARRAAALDVHENLLAVSTTDGSRVHVLDASSGKRIRTLVGNQESAHDLAFSPNGSLLAAGVGDGRVNVWDVGSGRIRHSLTTGGRGGITFSDFGDTLYTGGSRSGSLLAWDLDGRRTYLTRIALDGFRPVDEGVVRVDPAGSWASVSRTAVGRPALQLGRLRPDSEVLLAMPAADWRGVGAWAPDASRYVYADDRGFLTILNPVDGSRLRRQRIASGPVVDISYAGADQLVALAEEDVLVVLDAETLDVRRRVRVPAVGTAVTATTGSAVVTSAASRGGATWRAPVRRWHLVDVDEGRILRSGEVGVGSAVTASLAPDGRRIAFGGETEDLAVLSMPDGTPLASSSPGSGQDVSAVAWSPDAARLVASIGSSLRLWDAVRGVEIARVSLPAGEVSAAAGFAPDGTVSIATLAGDVYRWDPSPRSAAEFACRVAGRELTPDEWRNAFGEREAQPVCS